MAYFDQYLFSKNERGLLKVLDIHGKRPRDLMRESDISHASLYLAFTKLRHRGLAKRFIESGRIYWKKTISIHEEKIGSEITTKVFVHTTIDTVKNCINQILTLRSGERVTIVEGTQNNSGWFDLFSESETIALNKAISSKRIICESILPESYFTDALKKHGNEWALSYTARPIITYVIKRDLIASNALLITLRNNILLMYPREVVVIEIQNKEIVSLIKGMVEVVKDTAKKVSINDDYTFTMSGNDCR